MLISQSFLSLAVLLGMATTTHGFPHRERSKFTSGHAEVRRAESTFNASNATLAAFASHAREVAASRMDGSNSSSSSSSSSTGCTKENVIVRKLFENLSSDERIAYTSALNCLMSLPAKTPSELALGAKTRYDDWVATHINQTLTIHGTANFLGWHRWFISEMEQSLRTECGYQGGIPYWDWTKTAQEGFNNSEIFDGSATSLSGNGVRLNYSSTDVIDLSSDIDTIILPHGTGGGCVTSGPFANLTVNLGPDALVLMNGVVDDAGRTFNYTPRCLKRDFTDYALTRYANTSSVLSLLQKTDDIYTFETQMQGVGAELGVHGGGHFGLGGDPGRDFYTSPGEPAFWSHHANIDRVWWMWQMLDPDARAENVSTAVNGPLTMNDQYAPHGNGTLSDLQNLGYVAEGKEVALGELMSTTQGIFCYIYE